MKAFIIGFRGAKAELIKHSLLNRCEHIYLFQNELDAIRSIEFQPDVIILNDRVKNSDPLDFVWWVRENSFASIIYLSRTTRFRYVHKVLKSGISEYIPNDSYCAYTIKKAVDRIKNSESLSAHKNHLGALHETSCLKSIMPIQYRLMKILL